MNMSQKLVTKEMGHFVKKNILQSKTLDQVGHRIAQANELVETLASLKGAAMKFGQLLAIEARDTLPDEVVKVLEKLQSQSVPMDYDEVVTILNQELQKKSEFITDFVDTPMASASIGQVHKAKYKDQDIVLKIQHPGIDKSVSSDVKILEKILNGLSKVSGKSQTDYSSFLKEMQKMFLQETNYLKEAEFTTTYAENFSNIDYIKIPKVYDEITTGRVLALSFESGKTLSDLVRADVLTKNQKYFYAQAFINLFLKEFTEHGLVQTDPNLGNFLLRPKTEELVLLDFGACRQFSDNFIKQYSRLVIYGYNRQTEDVINQALKMNLIHSKESVQAQQALAEFMIESLSPFREKLYDFTDDSYMKTVKAKSRDMVMSFKQTPPPRDLIFLHRKLNGIFQILRRLEVTIDLNSQMATYQKLSGL